MLEKMLRLNLVFMKITEENKMSNIKNSIQGGRPMLTRDDMHEYQKRAVKHIIKVKKCGLWLDMGL